MQRVESMVLPPGECTHCGGLRGPFVDTLKEDQRGRVYVCFACAGTFADLLDVDAPLRARVDAAERRASETVAVAAQDREHLDTLRKAVVLTLQQGAATKAGVIVLRKRSR